MKTNLLNLLLLALLAVVAVAAQSDDIPIENDNQFPPEDHLEEPETADDVLEGSGKGITESDAPFEYETTTAYPLEEVEAVIDEETTTLGADESCPSPCLCITEGDDFRTDCSGLVLTEFPSPLNPETTILTIDNNQLTEIPMEISKLKKLKTFNAENNSIMEIIPGAISELPELTVLKLANNRLLEIPLDLKNSFQLSKLEELDLGGNDIRAELSPELFTKFELLKHLTLPTSKEDLLEDICAKLKNLDTICTGSCDAKSYECIDVPHTPEDDALDAILPGMLSFQEDSDKDPSLDILDSISEQNEEQKSQIDNGENFLIQATNIEPTTDVTSAVLQSSRSAFKKEAEEQIPNKLSDMLETPKDSNKAEADVKVGATTTDAAPGAVNRSVIGFVVAAMVVIVAGISIGKNWTSIRKRFQSSNSRTPERHANANGNGTSPDEVPLKEKDKSPV